MQELSGLPYYHVDVFSAEALAGNGLTVFFPDAILPVALMQKLTQEMRQFESIFVSATALRQRYDVRIFTMEEELDFAGHPLLGTAGLLHHLHAAHQARADWELMLGARAVQLTTERRADCYGATMNQGPATFAEPLSRAASGAFLDAFNLSAQQASGDYPLQVVSTGLPYLIVPITGGLEHARIVRDDLETLLATVGAKFAYVLDVAACEGRTWDNAGLVEDVATGSAAGPAGAYLIRHGAAAAGEVLTIRQGRFVGRPSRITVCLRGDASGAHEMLVSGDVTIVARGEML